MKLFEFFEEGTGKLSSIRLVTTAWALGQLIVWMYVCIHTGTMVPIDASIIGMTGALLAGKVGQKFGEKV